MEIKVSGQVQDVAKVLNCLFEQTKDPAVYVVGDGAQKVATSVLKVLDDFKCSSYHNELEDDKGVYIRLFE